MDTKDYEVKQARYEALCDAMAQFNDLHDKLKALCDEAMREMQEEGSKLIANAR